MGLVIVLSYAMMFCASIALILGMRLKSNTLKPIVLMVLASFSADLVFNVAYDFFDYYVPYSGFIYRVIEFVTILEFYYRVLGESRLRVAKIIVQIISVVIFLSFTSLSSTPVKITSSIVFSILAVIYFYKLIQELKIQNMLQYPPFWINSAILIYFSGSLFLFLLFKPLGQLDEVIANISYSFHNALGIVKNILLAISFNLSYKYRSWEVANDVR